MMSNTPQQPAANMDQLIANHQSEQSVLEQDDVVSVAGLFKAVGNELHTVDHKYVGGNSTTRALQLEQQKVFNAPVRENTPPPQPQAVPPVQQQPVAPQVPQQQVAQPVPEAKAVPPIENPPRHESSELSHRVDQLEKRVSKLIRKPSVKFNVKFKSETITEVVDNFDDLVDCVRKSLNKKSKRITIVLNEN